jgi:hypothetical protein
MSTALVAPREVEVSRIDMAAARKDVAETITDFEQRCVGRNPKLVQAKTVGSLLVARSSTCLAPIGRKRLRETSGSLRFARVKRNTHWRPSARSSGTSAKRARAIDSHPGISWSIRTAPSRAVGGLMSSSSRLNALPRMRSDGSEGARQPNGAPHDGQEGGQDRGETSSLYGPSEDGGQEYGWS